MQMSKPSERKLLSEVWRRTEELVHEHNTDDELYATFPNVLKDSVYALLFVCSLWFLVTGNVVLKEVSSIVFGIVIARYFASQYSLAEERTLRKSGILERQKATEDKGSYKYETVNSDQSKKVPLIFISYSRKDKDYVSKLTQVLRNKGFAVWLDDQIDYGKAWPRVIEEHLNNCDAFVLVMTPRSRESHWVTCELNYALEKKKLILPILLEGDRWLDVTAIQTFNVENGSLPSELFFNAISLTTPEKKVEENSIQVSRFDDSYNLLANALASKSWQSADVMTLELIKLALNRQQIVLYPFLTTKEILAIPCVDLARIDELWRRYSNDRFGISIQRDIYLDCGGTLVGDVQLDESFKRFQERVGWRDEESWILNWNLSAPKGHLPVLQSRTANANGTGFNSVNWVSTGPSYAVHLFRRLQECDEGNVKK